MKRKTFKKWIMGVCGFSRNDSEYICRMITKHKKSYAFVYAENVSDPWLNNILDSILQEETK